jgi:CubicO group peptidase (beta-lactamase class C family)
MRFVLGLLVVVGAVAATYFSIQAIGSTTRDGLAAYAAVGFGGQVVAMVPQLDLVFVMASDTAGVPADWESVLFRQIVPAAHGNT